MLGIGALSVAVRRATWAMKRVGETVEVLQYEEGNLL